MGVSPEIRKKIRKILWSHRYRWNKFAVTAKFSDVAKWYTQGLSRQAFVKKRVAELKDAANLAKKYGVSTATRAIRGGKGYHYLEVAAVKVGKRIYYAYRHRVYM